jgi:rhamnose utilization protein RhaD (predicted bifunctional aldolase and dehydrogenase)/NAD(P)-dependent dehydrogenase (short-subunit alcohol dehydrogenase family)
MQSRWSEAKAQESVEKYGVQYGADLALRTYSSRLLGSEAALVLHGGGNTSVKTSFINILGECFPAIFVKASGFDLASIEPPGHAGLQLEYLLKLRTLESLSDDAMLRELRTHFLSFPAPTPSIESLAHAFISEKFIDHTHAGAILALTNQPEGKARIQEALGPDVFVLDYVAPGFALARAAAAAYDTHPRIKGMVWMRHGLVTWGITARQSYETTIELVSKAERYLADHASHPLIIQVRTPPETAEERWRRMAPVLRGALAGPQEDPDRDRRRVILQRVATSELLSFLDSDRGKEIALTPPLTSDHLIRIKAFPLWIDSPNYDDVEKLRDQMAQGVADYSAQYEAYVRRNLAPEARAPQGVPAFDPAPRLLLIPGLGAVCAGRNLREAKIACDITAHTLAVKSQMAAMSVYEGLPEADLFEMEYRGFQQAKLKLDLDLPLASHVALVTGAAGAIGSAIAEGLLEQGCQVAVTDLPGEKLDRLEADLKSAVRDRVLKVPMDVTDPDSVKKAHETVIGEWGGIDLAVVNAGVALVSPLAEMSLEAFRKLERVNVEGALLVIGESARMFRLQGTGGDIVLISTKNVFAPGAQFGAYSATKAAAHQLARIASLELADIGVRVNMVAPDAIFSHGERRSGLWQEVGPDRMRARGLSEAGLEEYYRGRNLLKVKVTARHVARAVLFFATRQTPTTGATIPVDGGLPDATPR